MSNLIRLLKTNWEIPMVWLFLSVGLIGIISPFGSWFIQFTPFNLLLLNSLLLIAINGIRKELLSGFLLLCVLAWLVEALGVYSGQIFGSYTYGNVLGPKVWQVPVLIGANWALLIFATGMITNQLFTNKWLRVLIGSFMMLVLDLVMEQVAASLQFWQFENDIVPLQNYIAWFVLSVLFHLYFQHKYAHLKHQVGHHLYFAQLLFFLVLFIQQ